MEPNFLVFVSWRVTTDGWKNEIVCFKLSTLLEIEFAFVPSRLNFMFLNILFCFVLFFLPYPRLVFICLNLPIFVILLVLLHFSNFGFFPCSRSCSKDWETASGQGWSSTKGLSPGMDSWFVESPCSVLKKEEDSFFQPYLDVYTCTCCGFALFKCKGNLYFYMNNCFTQ